MKSFRDNRLRDYEAPMGCVLLLNDIAEFKGKQDTLVGVSPEALQTLRDTSTIQSVESSNRIEGVTVSQHRLRPLVLENSRPKDRAEHEVLGYRLAFDEICADPGALPVNPATLKRLHALCQSTSGDAGEFKRIDNEIVSLSPGQPPSVRFRCLAASETPEAIEELCLLYRYTLEQDNAPPLVAIAALVLDFLCIHPFRDGNGRVSRLLTLLALLQHGYEIGRYISLERLVEESRESYYDCLHQSSRKWHEAEHDPTPWFSFFFAIIRRAYSELEDRLSNNNHDYGHD